MGKKKKIEQMKEKGCLVKMEEHGSSVYYIIQSYNDPSKLYNVIYNKKTKRWSCDCYYFSAYGKGNTCSHIEYAMWCYDNRKRKEDTN